MILRAAHRDEAERVIRKTRKGAGRDGGCNVTTQDPSSPRITAPITVTYTEEGGSSGTLGNDETHFSEVTTTVTLFTERTAEPQSREIWAVGVGPGMFPSPPIHFTVEVGAEPVIDGIWTGVVTYK